MDSRKGEVKHQDKGRQEGTKEEIDGQSEQAKRSRSATLCKRPVWKRVQSI